MKEWLGSYVTTLALEPLAKAATPVPEMNGAWMGSVDMFDTSKLMQIS